MTQILFYLLKGVEREILHVIKPLYCDEYDHYKTTVGKSCMKAGIVEAERTSIAEQRFGDHFPAAKYNNEQVYLIGNACARDNRRNDI
jgi:hypothetical protein